MLSARGSQLRRASYDARNFHKSSLDSSVNIVTRLQADNPGSIPARGKERASSLTCPHRPSDSPSRVLLPGVQQNGRGADQCREYGRWSHTAAQWSAQRQLWLLPP